MREDIKFPAIIDNIGYNQKVLIFKCGKAYHLDGDHKGVWSKGEYCIESQCKNITREYLANTYGKVESKEHAEFIELLAKVNGFNVSVSVAHSTYFVFYDRFVDFYSVELSKLSVEDMKQITIPMPPKEVDEIPDHNVLQDRKIECDSDEWPVIGDTVVINTDKEHPLTFDKVGFASVNLEVIAKTERKGGVILTLENNALCVIALLHGDWIKKPKTPEEELRDELSKQLASLTNESLSSEGSWIISIADAIMNNELNGFDIKKKQ